MSGKPGKAVMKPGLEHAEQYGALREGRCYYRGKLAATEVIQHGDSDTVASNSNNSKHYGFSGGA